MKLIYGSKGFKCATPSGWVGGVTTTLQFHYIPLEVIHILPFQDKLDVVC